VNRPAKTASEMPTPPEGERAHGWLVSFRYAWAGMTYAWRSQANFRIEACCAALALGVAVWLRVPLVPILLTCALVLSLELLNTALEALVDLVSPEWHPLAKVAKDTAAAAVLIASFFALLVAASQFIPAFVARFTP